jgi:hypothetical protein
MSLRAPTASLLVLGLVVALLSTARAEDPPMERPTWRVGDRWVYRGNGDRGPYRMTDTVKRVGQFEGRPAYFVERVSELLDGSRRWVFTVVFDQDLYSIATLDARGRLEEKVMWQFFRWPLRPWDHREFEYTWYSSLVEEDGTWTVGKGRLHQWVLGWEVVETPAGKFRALRYHVVNRFYDAQGQATGHAIEEGWLSPDARNWVRYRWKRLGNRVDWTEDELLVEFQPAR